jgi:hypothetical protein
LKAVLLAQATFNLRDRDVNYHIDNAGDIFALVRGTHKSARGTAIIHALFKKVFDESTSVFFDYVKSELNISDAWTRWGKQQKAEAWLKPTMLAAKMEEIRAIDRITNPVPLEGKAEPLLDVARLFPNKNAGEWNDDEGALSPAKSECFTLDGFDSDEEKILRIGMSKEQEQIADRWHKRARK